MPKELLMLSRRDALMTSLFPFMRNRGERPIFSPLEQEPKISILPGDVLTARNGTSFVVKRELDQKGLPIFIRYQLTDFLPWAKRVGFKRIPKEVDESTLSQIQLAKVPTETFYTQWNNKRLRHNRNGGIKLGLISGMLTDSYDGGFDVLKYHMQHELGGYSDLHYDGADFLDFTYVIDTNNPKLGKEYSKQDSTQDPQKTLEAMSQLMYLWKKQFPLEKMWLIGHSQGGWLAFELAKLHPDAVCGVILLDASVKGANFDYVPEGIQEIGGELIGGDAARFFIKRASEPDISMRVESEAKGLQSLGIVVDSFCSTDDDVIRSPYSYIESSNKFFGCFPVYLSWGMGSWREWPVAQKVAVAQSTCLSLSCLPLDLPEPVSSDSSAQLQQKVGEYVGKHGAILTNDTVIEEIMLIIDTTTPIVLTKDDDFQADEKIFIDMYQPLISKTPYSGPDFNADYTDRLTLRITVKNKSADVKAEVEAWMMKNCVDPASHHIVYI